MLSLPCVSTELRVQEIHEPAALEAVAPEWRDLWERCLQLSCFQHPDWLLPWVRHFFRGEKIWALALRQEGRLAALAPLFIHRHHRNRQVRQVSFLGAGISDYLDILCEPEVAGPAAAMIFSHLLEHRDRWDVCDLQELPGPSPIVAASLPSSLCHAWLECGTCPVVSLPATEADFEDSLRGRFKSLRRMIQRLERDPAVQITAADETTCTEYLQDLFGLHRERWKERHECGMFANPEIRGFHFDVAAAFSCAGFLRAYRMRCDGDTISVWYGFACRGRYYAYLTGFHPEFARYSPGQVLLAHSMKAAVAEGARSYDFLRKTEDFKHRWGGADFVNRRLLAWHDKSRLPCSDFVETARADLAAL